VPDVEDFTITPRQAEVRQVQETQRRTHDVSAVKRLVDAGALPDGTELTLVVAAGANNEIREAVEAWRGANPARGRARWINDTAAPLRWEADGQCYTPSGLARHVMAEAADIDRSVQGTRWWVDEDGRDLVELSGALIAGKGGRYLSFWTQFLDRVRAEHPDWTSASASTANWLATPGPTGNATYNFSFATGSRLRCELYIDTGSQDTTKSLFDRLVEDRTEIETAFGNPLTWERLDERRASRIADYSTGNADNEAEYALYIDWFIDASQRLRAALAKRLSP